MKRAIASIALIGALAMPAVAQADVMCTALGQSTATCSGYQDSTYVSYTCQDLGYELDCTMTMPYYRTWTVREY